MNLTNEQKLKFWSKVNIKGIDDCWLWKAGTTRGGYGLITVNQKHYRANRIAWALANGRMPKDDMDVCHSCDTPACCNPNHLSENTRQWNLKDAQRKGRLRSGTQRLQKHQVLEIRQANGKHADIAKRYGIHPGTVSKIKRLSMWRTLD